MSQKKYSVVIVGFGGMGHYHSTLIKKNDVLEVTGVYDVKQERLDYGIELGYQAYPNLAEVLADKKVDVVLIATPNDVHSEIAIAALEAGKHVICEKPVTLSSQEFIEIDAVAKKVNKVFMTHQNRRWDEDFLIVKEMYDQQSIGDIFQIESRVHGANGIPGDWRHEAAHGGGMLLDWGVHLLDQMLYMVDSKIISVRAELSFILGDEVDDGFISTLTFENGVTAIVEVGTTNYISLPRWYVKGTEGTALIEDWSMKGKMVKRNWDAEKVEPKPIQAGVGLTKTMAPPSEEATNTLDLPQPQQNSQSFYDNFASVIEEKAEPIVKNTEVLRNLRLIEAVFEAARTNQIITKFE
ncbi:Gfo/Idh/MocA family protein [Carnobacterium gallinarum]|uniref:Gfo/Idh/MocA family protein n=1 Tax=Carnobacterium gallinarum TaxID=2749 RepID=UPI0005509400|nr:Gfo/Idh/MocA family oxidoreductase [Carnobacterium gallinarum]